MTVRGNSTRGMRRPEDAPALALAFCLTAECTGDSAEDARAFYSRGGVRVASVDCQYRGGYCSAAPDFVTTS